MELPAIGWTIAGLGMIALSVGFWRSSTSSKLNAILVIICSLGISLALSGTILSFFLFTFSLVLIAITWRMIFLQQNRRILGKFWIACLLLLFLMTKLSFAEVQIGPAIWIGVSYLFLRLLHISLDALHGRIENVSLSQMIIYMLHPATLVAGPIDRIQHSISEQKSQVREIFSYVNEGLWRIFFGLFKKLVLANALYSVTVVFDPNQRIPDSMGAWIWLSAYTFYLYFDFSAYSDIAIGTGLLLGMRVPENFTKPYLQSNIAQFWQSWHITLSTWLRDYVFFPISRTLLKWFGSRYSPVILFVSHIVTMILSGLWHGFRPELIIWGVWHGTGLWIYNRWTIFRRRYKIPGLPIPVSIFANFLFVALGWGFFALRVRVALRLFEQLLFLR